MTNPLRKGDRIRLKARTMSGWKGTGTVVEDQRIGNPSVQFVKDGDTPEIPSGALRHEVAKLRDQTA